MATRTLIVALAAIVGVQAPGAAQQPRIGLGVNSGVILGSRLTERAVAFPSGSGSPAGALDLAEAPVMSAHAEWYVTPHIALRGHVARGSGRLETSSRPLDGLDVQITALDLGVSLFPWDASEADFVPFVSMGVGTFRYEFEDDRAAEWLPDGPDRRNARALVLGAGADMRLWHGLMLRMEAINHRAEPPVDASDIGAEPISNVRFVIGAHINIPSVSPALAQ